MGIKNVFNQAPTLEEEVLYKQVHDEVESGVMRIGAYTKALAALMKRGILYVLVSLTIVAILVSTIKQI
jgi:hypothetical protein